MLETPPLSLYIHIPWCTRKCPYCDFNSHTSDTALPQTEYIKALCEDFDAELERIPCAKDKEIGSIFIGGGTPSMFDAASFEKLLGHIREKSTLAKSPEITLEANPGTVEATKFEEFRAAGINRLSIGVQSFNDEKLRALGRVHDSREAKTAIEIAKKAGFENLNLDLMHGLPGQDYIQAINDLNTAIEYAPTHLSWYQLTIEPNTVFYRKPPSLPKESLIQEVQEIGLSIMEDHGFHRYEVSAYAQHGRECVHNLNYWEFADYIGIGAGAHGKLTNIETDTIFRTRKLKQPTHYLYNSSNRDAESIEIHKEERALEFLLNALRIKRGFSTDLFMMRTGVPFSTIAKKVEYLSSKGFLSKNGNRVSATKIGYALLNSVLEEFL